MEDNTFDKASNVYNSPTPVWLTKSESEIYQSATREIESSMVVIEDLHDELTNEGGEFVEPISPTYINTVLEVTEPLRRSLATLQALEDLK
ncbi:hypothetical protein [Halobaculum sp. D14]|uniref:hypothetical protein n=1 Tax=Halobaculum sp. D14 TaxID=3421642 RepID=UPI003EBDA2D8